jgi:hypothetical protein
VVAEADDAQAGRSWTVPRRVLLISVAISVLLLIPLAGGYVLSGVPAALGIGMGYVVLLRPALTLPARRVGLLVVGTGLVASVAVGLRGQPLAAAAFVALCCLAVAPANRMGEGMLAGLPTAASVLVAVPGTFEPAAMAGWALLGGVAAVLVGTRVPKAKPPRRLDRDRAQRYAVVMATAAGLVTFLVLAFDVPHGYWVALTLTVVLRPFDDETRTKAWERLVGTFGGILLAVLLAALLPLWAIAVALAACLVLMTAYALRGDYTRQVLFLTPCVVLLGSPGDLGLVAADRALATLAGAVLAALIAMAMVIVDSRKPGRQED